jgi:hypothetical protein
MMKRTGSTHLDSLYNIFWSPISQSHLFSKLRSSLGSVTSLKPTICSVDFETFVDDFKTICLHDLIHCASIIVLCQCLRSGLGI